MQSLAGFQGCRQESMDYQEEVHITGGWETVLQSENKEWGRLEAMEGQLNTLTVTLRSEFIHSS